MIRKLVKNDIPAVGEALDSIGLLPSGMLPYMLEPYLHPPVGFAYVPQEIWLVYEKDGAARGVAYFKEDLFTVRTWELVMLMIHPDYQQEQAGSLLVTEGERMIRELEGRMIIVSTMTSLHGARSFYPKHGYVEASVLPEFYEAKEDRITFYKRLDQ